MNSDYSLQNALLAEAYPQRNLTRASHGVRGVLLAINWILQHYPGATIDSIAPASGVIDMRNRGYSPTYAEINGTPIPIGANQHVMDIVWSHGGKTYNGEIKASGGLNVSDQQGLTSVSFKLEIKHDNFKHWNQATGITTESTWNKVFGKKGRKKASFRDWKDFYVENGGNNPMDPNKVRDAMFSELTAESHTHLFFTGGDTCLVIPMTRFSGLKVSGGSLAPYGTGTSQRPLAVLKLEVSVSKWNPNTRHAAIAAGALEDIWEFDTEDSVSSAQVGQHLDNYDVGIAQQKMELWFKITENIVLGKNSNLYEGGYWIAGVPPKKWKKVKVRGEDRYEDKWVWPLKNPNNVRGEKNVNADPTTTGDEAFYLESNEEKPDRNHIKLAATNWFALCWPAGTKNQPDAVEYAATVDYMRRFNLSDFESPNVATNDFSGDLETIGDRMLTKPISSTLGVRMWAPFFLKLPEYMNQRNNQEESEDDVQENKKYSIKFKVLGE